MQSTTHDARRSPATVAYSDSPAASRACSGSYQVQFYAVPVFAGFLAALFGCARLSLRDRRWVELSINVVGVALVNLVLLLNVSRADGAIALGASGLVASYLYLVWVRRGRPGGVGEVEISAS
jgi:hypothetical protein